MPPTPTRNRAPIAAHGGPGTGLPSGSRSTSAAIQERYRKLGAASLSSGRETAAQVSGVLLQHQTRQAPAGARLPPPLVLPHPHLPDARQPPAPQPRPEFPLLGALPDAEVAARTGRTENAVTVRRLKLKRPTALDRRRRPRC